MKNKIISVILAVVTIATAFSFSAAAENYYASDENGSTSIPDYIASVNVSSEGVEIPEEAKNNTYELTPDGNLTLVDDYYEQSESGEVTQKQFLTVTTKSGNTFYIVVDRDGNTDNVYLLNLVDEADLMALINDEEVTVESTSETEPESTSSEESKENEKDEEKKTNSGPLLLIVVVIAGGGFAYYWFKVRNNAGKTETVEITDFDPDDDEIMEEDENE